MCFQNNDRADEKPQNEKHELNTPPSSGANEYPQKAVDDSISIEPGAKQKEGLLNDGTDLGAQKSARIKAAKERLAKLIVQSERNSWQIGDLLIELSRDGVTLAQLEHLGWQSARLSQIRKTAEMYPPSERDERIPFYTYEVARAAAKLLKKDIEQRIAQNPAPEVLQVLMATLPLVSSPKAAMKAILEEEAVLKPTKNKGLKKKKLKKREATNLLGTIVRRAIDAALSPPALTQEHPILDRCFHSTNEVLLSSWIQQGIELQAKLIGLDPPYGRYDKHKDGQLDIHTSAAQHVGADNIARDDAIATTAASIRLLPLFLAEGGVILLWQAAQSLHPSVHAALLESGFEEDIVLVWDKDRPQPGDFTEAYTQQSEFCYVWKRKGEKLLNHDSSLPRSNVIRDIWFKNPPSPIENSHIWRKPEELMEFLVRKHSNKGDIVLDLFACTGSLSKVAAKLDRRFVYVESRPENFAIQSEGVLRALSEAQEARSVDLPTLQNPSGAVSFSLSGENLPATKPDKEADGDGTVAA
jgi:DNA modification methylase